MDIEQQQYLESPHGHDKTHDSRVPVDDQALEAWMDPTSHHNNHKGEEEKSLSNKEAEYWAIQDVKAAFLYYKTYTINTCVRHRLRAIDALSERHRNLVSKAGTIDKIFRIEKAIRANDCLLHRILAINGGIMPDESSLNCEPEPAQQSDIIPRDQVRRFFKKRQQQGLLPAKEHHIDKLRSTFRQFVRDWSEEGKVERDSTYGPLLDELEYQFSHLNFQGKAGVSVLVPGAGLGRLALEIADRGYSCQGNEFSYFMLFSSNFILNYSLRKEQYAVYPYIHSLSNIISIDSQLRAVKIPDVLPQSMLGSNSQASFSMVAGDFVEIYGANDQAEKWDAVVTCFFMDTAKNVMDYLDTLWNCLRPGGVWINLGPLLWHFENIPGEQSIELSLEEFLHVAKATGFVFDEKKFRTNIPLSYTADIQSMLEYKYKCFFTVAHKPK
ncbi:hypothetical protein H4219_000862 [Mycoemilia scoparia]|uniref:carnosine N-methyltransferase n=1 Tax=Mycoemilia scoparia TaxID=417184 RepID=A0A9W8A213_9FUNG|nr:hypothetical protein H4219_000862 [Mycoemilia scoparia]